MQKLSLIFISIIILGLAGCGVNSENLIIKSFDHPKGVYFYQERLNASTKILNQTKNEKEIWIEFKIKDEFGKLIDSHIEKKQISSGAFINYTMYWTIPKDFKSGNYETELIVWDRSPENSSAIKIGESIDKKGFSYFQNQENFDALDENIWKISDSILGRSYLKNENVSVFDGQLKILMPKNTYDGGEIYTKDLQKYGAFEIRMKLPVAPTSITGFFLYKSPDYFYEIDIELYNEPDGTFMLTTYSDGKKNNEYVDRVNFDPTKEFHNYRIDYNENRVAFYIDNIFIKSWSDGFPKEGMNLMINSWYPKWLNGEKTKEDQYLLVDWIRY